MSKYFKVLTNVTTVIITFAFVIHHYFASEVHGLPNHVTTVIKGIAGRLPRMLEETILRLMFDLAHAESQGKSSDDDEDASDENKNNEDFDHGYNTGISQPTHSEIAQLRK